MSYLFLALALGAQRLLQQIYSGLASLKSNHAAIQSVFLMLNQPLPSQVTVDQTLSVRECPPGGGAIFVCPGSAFGS